MAYVRNNDTDFNYLVVGHVNYDPRQLTLLHIGRDVEKLPQIMDDSKVLYALAKYQMFIVDSKTVKFVYFHWIGEKVPFVEKVRYGVVHGSVEEKFSPFHLFIKTSNIDDFCTEKIMEKVMSVFEKK
ncbi:hypothetical protein FSP39_006651 [Pinctada imbricata]|uniref:ADF-H domain-containing protein n=1 Tax=Pinctada imbricata TaxID=66713 RepID=A0AA88XLD3_PINIB|nr:hypothetical protein FSP39_006651 [Pinctada imbricata]